MQIDDLLTFQQFSNRLADDAIVVCDFKTFRGLGDIGRATGSTEIPEDFVPNLSRILRLTGNYLLSSSML